MNLVMFHWLTNLEVHFWLFFIVVLNLFMCQPSGPVPIADVKSLTHYGEPYDGNTRFFRSTLFVAAVRSCYNEASLLHGVDWMPPKVLFFCSSSFWWLLLHLEYSARYLSIPKVIYRVKGSSLINMFHSYAVFISAKCL